jgi:hypothetical protein
MRHLIILLLAYPILFSSCRSEAKKQKERSAASKALQEERVSEYSLKKGRIAEDIIESLYNELKDKTPVLQELENRIDAIKEQKDDSVDLFEKFDYKNTNYYNTADRYIGSIHDSLLKQKMKMLIGKSLGEYNNRVLPHAQWISLLENKDISLNDLYTVLKLSKTISIMENYQKTNLPPAKSLQAVGNEYDRIIQQTDKLAKN